jgi:hypothetical protein
VSTSKRKYQKKKRKEKNRKKIRRKFQSIQDKNHDVCEGTFEDSISSIGTTTS